MYTYKGNDFTKKAIIRIAKFQRYFLFSFLIGIILLIVSRVFLPSPDAEEVSAGAALLGLIIFVVGIISLIVELVSFICLEIEMKANTVIAVIEGILLLVPCIGFVIVLFVNSSATKILKAASLSVGLLGVSKSDIRQLEQSL